MKMIRIIACVLAVLILLGWLGLQIKPAPFSPYPEQMPLLKTVPLPEGLPAPVERFYRTVYGDEIPVIETVVIKGRAGISPFGVKLPARFIFVHNAGKDYRHYIEATWFGMPILKVNEGYLDGKSFFESPMGTIYDDASTNQAANLAIWAEAAWFPSIWLTDERVRWEPVDDKTALLFVPFEDKEENFVMRFNPETGLLDSMEAMRFRDAGDQAKKILWITKSLEGKNIEGTRLSSVGSATWLVPLIILLAPVAAGAGLFWQDGGSSFSFTTVRGEIVPIYGQGLYHLTRIKTSPSRPFLQPRGDHQCNTRANLSMDRATWRI